MINNINEFRLGNWIGLIGTERAYQLNKSNFFEYLESEHSKPVELTEKWLEMFGCEKETDNSKDDDFEFIYRDKRGQFRLTKNKDGYWSYWPEEIWGFNIDLGKEPAAHTIQNIYFILEGKELEIKQPIKV